MIPKPHFFDFSREELENLPEFSSQKYRVRQISRWLIGRHPHSFDEITNLPLSLRENLSKRFEIRKLKIFLCLNSGIDPTAKLTFETKDRRHLSSVFLPHIKYHSLCISSQIGCAFECRYCASGQVSFKRNLSSGEILDQVVLTEEKTNQKVKNILFMGMGEPLANYDPVIKSIEWLISEHGFKFSPKNITLSTTGIPNQIMKLSDKKMNVNLALSLHAPNDAIRKKIMPVSAQFPIADLLSACKRFQSQNNSDFTIEYILIRDINDRLKESRELLNLIRSFKFSPLPKINLIPCNPAPRLKYEKPNDEQVEFFFRFFKNNGFTVHTRKAQGEDIGAACGQLS